MAVVFWLSFSLCAILCLIRVILTRFSVRAPAGTTGFGAAAGLAAGGAAGAAAFGAAAAGAGAGAAAAGAGAGAAAFAAGAGAAPPAGFAPAASLARGAPTLTLSPAPRHRDEEEHVIEAAVHHLSELAASHKLFIVN